MSTVLDKPDTKSESYNQIPYPGGAFRATHPSHLAMVSRLLGIESAKPSKCRVLELGCSMGANLIPMAHGLPESQFLGIDFAEVQVEEGMKVIRDLGLSNIELRHQSILDFEATPDSYDYVICHGVYSWVAPEVQKSILEIGAKCLSPNGVMYVSYNTYPGWHFRGLIRDMMQYHVQDFPNPKDKIAQAKGLLDFLVKYARPKSPAYPTLLKEEAEMLAQSLDSYLFHEHLEDVNEPVYFHEFVRRADAAGLRYMADSALTTMVAQLFDESAAEILRHAPILRREQYMDFLRNRMFRGSLLCHPNLQPDYRLPSSNVFHLHVALKHPLESAKNESGQTGWRNADGNLTTNSPITEVIAKINEAFPSWVSIADIIKAEPNEGTKKEICDALLMGFVHGLFALSSEPQHIESKLSEKPACNNYVQYQAKRGPKVTSLLHNDYIVQPQQRFLMAHMDGTHTQEELVQMLKAECEGGRFKIVKEGENRELNADELDEVCKAELDRLRFLTVLAS
jgi:methyltransferase-like protein/cyclopropane fatty-acyl-phospholipid synthase-like methyltransferase